MPDGTFRMYFSADIIGKDGPADLLGATSPDGLQWTVDVRPILERAHDPTVIIAGGNVVIFTTFLGDNFIVLESPDGRAFTSITWLDFFSRSGSRMEEFGDADVAFLPDGRLALYGSGKGSRGISTVVAAPP